MAVCLLLVALTTGCATGPEVRSATAPGVNLASDFQTFSFLPELSTDRAGFHTIVSRELMSSTRREMEVRGFTFVENPAEAELLINFHTDLADQFRVRNTPTPQHWHGNTFWNHRRGFYDPWHGHRHWPTHSTSTVQIDQITEGTLNVDLISATSNRLVWEGVASKRLTQQTLNQLGPALDNAVHEMFRQFPVPPRL